MIIINLKPTWKLIKTILLPSLTMALILILTGQLLKNGSHPLVLGAYMSPDNKINLSSAAPVASVFGNKNSTQIERFYRPSKQPSMSLKYNFKTQVFPNKNSKTVVGNIPTRFNSAQDLIHAYFAIMKEAAFMGKNAETDYSVGMGEIPYPYAYKLFSSSLKNKISLNDFKNSFLGIGHISLLKLSPLSSKKLPSNMQGYMVELEVLREMLTPDDKVFNRYPSYFNYYYGIIITEFNEKDGWKLHSMYYIPEKFLTPLNQYWSWNAENVVTMLYQKEYKLIDRIDKIEATDSFVSVYTSGSKGKYRFDFIRLTNGEDVLVHEYKKEGLKWKETDLLKPEHRKVKLSPDEVVQ